MGGKQIILVGEFLQLRPVPDLFDEGKFLFFSPIFQKCFSHRFQLTTNMRQGGSMGQFSECLKDVRLGHCSEETLAFLNGLSRPISAKDPVHIFFRRFPVQLHNLDVLFSLRGEMMTFEAIDQKDTQNIKCPAERVLLLKPGCSVMLLWNK